MRALSVKKGWWVGYSGDTQSHNDMESWLDALKLGDLHKNKLPVLGSDVVTPPEPPKEEEVTKEAPKHEEL